MDHDTADYRLLDSLLEGCQLVDPDFRYVYLNSAATLHARRSRHDLVGKRMTDVYPGIENTPMFARLKRCMESGRSDRLVNEFSYPDGSTAWFDLRFEKVPMGVFVLSIDISLQKAAEDELRRRNRALAALSACNKAVVRAMNERELVEEVALGAVEHGGFRAAVVFTSQEVLIAQLAKDLPGAARARLAQVLRDDTGGALRKPKVRSLEDSELAAAGVRAVLLLPLDDGTLGTLALYARDPAEFGEGEQDVLAEMAQSLGFGISRLRGNAARSEAEKRDRQSKRELESVRARTRAIQNHLPLPTLVWEVRDDDFVLVDLNEAAKSLAGSDADALVGSDAEEFERGLPGLRSDLRECFESRESIRREVDTALPGRSEPRHLVLHYGFVPNDLVVLHAEDITDLRDVERRLRVSQRLEAIGQLAGGIAHDFNNLLTIILGSAQMVLDELPEHDEQRADVDEIRKAGRRAADLTRQLLAFSRKQVLEPKVLDLNEVVRSTESLLRRVLGEHIDLAVQLHEPVGNVEADPSQLEQVVMNLAVNARDAMPRGGRLLIETEDVEVGDEYAANHPAVTPGRFVLLAVTDTGVGMDEATRDRIFEPFFTTKEPGQGTGLGLATVYGIVKQSGGFIWVYSEPDEGTTFKIYLPRVDRPATAAVRDQAERSDYSGTETVLVVEDEDGVRRLAARILEKSGYRVVTAASGAQALDLCAQLGRGLDLLITDVVMPKMSGQELANRLVDRFSGLRVLYFSGYTDNAIVHHGRLAPGTHFLGKPFSRADLTKKVRAVLEEDRCRE